MSKPLVSLLLAALLLSACESSEVDTETTPSAETAFIEFTADSEIILEEASNAGVKMDAEGVLQLVYQDNQSKGDRITSSTKDSDWLEFERGESLKDRTDFYSVQMPDGTYRTYGYNPTIGLAGETCLTSKISTGGINFTQEEGCRYELTDNDKGTMGVWDVYSTENGEVHLLYIGDMLGKNSVRKAVSTDNGWTFTYVEDNVLGGETFGPESYVDQRSIRMEDGRILLVAMKQGGIYEFISEDDGKTFTLKPEPILTKEDYSSLNALSLHDPQLVALPDGRYRIYVTASIDNGGTTGVDIPPAVLVTATSSL